MKVLAVILIIGGIAAIILAVITVLMNFGFFGVTGAGFLRGAMSLLLLALALMVYDRIYCSQ
jgi:hypothetical protein